MELLEEIKNAIREVPDFPKQGINFKDITPILENPYLSSKIINYFAALYEGKGFDAIVGVESRGFLFGMPLAQKLGLPFIIVRKKGKLPYKTISYKYDLEYGTAEIEMHVDAIKKGWKVLIHDDLLATGGTAIAAAELVKMHQAEVAGFTFLIGLDFLNGKEKLQNYTNNIVTLINY